MSNVKGNDIDDLFKRASDNYPLRTDSSDWDKLSAALDKDPSLIVPPLNAEGDKRRRKRFFWLFLLLPLGGLVYYVGQTTGHNLHGSTPSAKVTSSQKAPAQPGTNSGATAPAGVANTPPKPTQQVQAEPGTATAQPSTGQPSVAQPGSAPAQQSAVPGQQPAAQQSSASAQPTSVSNQQASAPAQPAAQPTSASVHPASAAAHGASAPAHLASAQRPSAHPAPAPTEHTSLTPGPVAVSSTPAKPGTSFIKENQVATNDVHKNTRLSGKHQNQQGKNHPAKEVENVPVSLEANRQLETNQSSVVSRNAELSKLNSRRAPTTGGVALNVTVKANNNPVTTNPPDKNNANKVAKNNTNNKNQHFLYGGLIVAPDLSTVKFQSIKGTGTTFGVLLGYQLNRKWAIETGVYYDHKKYYTDGEYFKKGPTNPNPTYKLLDVTGGCNMWEIPINIRYNLSTGEKTKWFATTGLSTYLMTKESYVYTYSYNGSTWPSTPWNSKAASQYWFSIINLSVGYEQKIGKIGNLRLEPYLRIPLKGMGSGSLPIMSAGLNIGITRKIW